MQLISPMINQLESILFLNNLHFLAYKCTISLFEAGRSVSIMNAERELHSTLVSDEMFFVKA